MRPHAEPAVSDTRVYESVRSWEFTLHSRQALVSAGRRRSEECGIEN